MSAAIRRAKHELRIFIGFEWLQMSVAIGTLLVIAIRAIIKAEDQAVAVATSTAVTVALVYIALSIRIRVSQERIRRELYALEHGDRAPDSRPATHPYRSSSNSATGWMRDAGHS